MFGKIVYDLPISLPQWVVVNLGVAPVVFSKSDQQSSVFKKKRIIQDLNNIKRGVQRGLYKLPGLVNNYQI